MHSNIDRFIVINSLSQCFIGIKSGRDFMWSDNWDEAKHLHSKKQLGLTRKNIILLKVM